MEAESLSRRWPSVRAGFIALTIALAAATISVFLVHGALRDGASETCLESSDRPAGTVFDGDQPQVSSALSVIPLGMLCTYNLRNGESATRFVNLASPLEFLVLGGFVISILSAVRRPGSSIRIAVGSVLLAVGLVGVVLTVSQLSISLSGGASSATWVWAVGALLSTGLGFYFAITWIRRVAL